MAELGVAGGEAAPASGLAALAEHRVPAPFGDLFYVPEFVSEDDEAYLLRKVADAPKPTWKVLRNRRLQNLGGHPDHRGLVATPLPSWIQPVMDRISDLGIYGSKTRKDGRTVALRANHTLVNEYLSGQGIMPHEDGPIFTPVIATVSLGSHTLLEFFHKRRDGDSEGKDDEDAQGEEAKSGQLHGDSGAQAPAENREAAGGDLQTPVFSLLLEPRSLVVVSGEAYGMLHGIAERTADTIDAERVANLGACRSGVQAGDTLTRSTRVSLTIRNVPRVIKVGNFFGSKK